jgi:hypothetical protein
MNQNDLVNRLCKIKDDVKSKLKKSGVVVPVKTNRGIKLDDFEIILEDNRYRIYNRWQEVEVDNINYLQTAVLAANNLALKKQVQLDILAEDMRAGAADFDRQIFEKRFKKSLAANDLFGMQHYSVQLSETKRKHKQYFTTIENNYQRLLTTLTVLGKTNK